MKNTKNIITTVFLSTAVFCTSAFADGDMGSGGKTCPEGQQTCFTSYDGPVKSSRLSEGDMGSGGFAADSTAVSYFDWVLNYFDWSM
jgi:hypothetical protein